MRNSLRSSTPFGSVTIASVDIHSRLGKLPVFGPKTETAGGAGVPVWVTPNVFRSIVSAARRERAVAFRCASSVMLAFPFRFKPPGTSSQLRLGEALQAHSGVPDTEIAVGRPSGLMRAPSAIPDTVVQGAS